MEHVLHIEHACLCGLLRQDPQFCDRVLNATLDRRLRISLSVASSQVQCAIWCSHAGYNELDFYKHRGECEEMCPNHSSSGGNSSSIYRMSVTRISVVSFPLSTSLTKCASTCICTISSAPRITPHRMLLYHNSS